MSLNKITRALYGAARVAGDINAVARGPKAVGARIIRKGVLSKVLGGTMRVLNRLLK